MRRVLILLFLYATLAYPKQMEPDVRRAREIKQALIDRGYLTGRPDDWTWTMAKEVCRRIAEQHGWQVNHAPDARVLILLGLGNQHSDTWVAEQPGNHLDKAQRGEI